MRQAELPGVPPRPRGGPLLDLNGCLPAGVWPTPVRVLTQNGEVLVIRQYDPDEELRDGHDNIWRTLSRHEGTTVICVWGTPPYRVAMQEYLDGHAQPRRLIEQGDFARYVESWWREATKLR